MKIELPWPPSVNNYWRHGRGKGRSINTYITPQGQMFRELVKAQLYDSKPMDGRIVCHIDAYPPDKRRRDIDNILKATLDALEHAGVYNDDSQIDHLSVKRCKPVHGGKLEVTLHDQESR